MATLRLKWAKGVYILLRALPVRVEMNTTIPQTSRCLYSGYRSMANTTKRILPVLQASLAHLIQLCTAFLICQVYCGKLYLSYTIHIYLLSRIFWSTICLCFWAGMVNSYVCVRPLLDWVCTICTCNPTLN